MDLQLPIQNTKNLSHRYSKVHWDKVRSKENCNTDSLIIWRQDGQALQPLHYRATRDLRKKKKTVTSTESSESLVNPTCTSLDCARKCEYLDRNPTGMRRTTRSRNQTARRQSDLLLINARKVKMQHLTHFFCILYNTENINYLLKIILVKFTLLI